MEFPALGQELPRTESSVGYANKHREVLLQLVDLLRIFASLSVQDAQSASNLEKGITVSVNINFGMSFLISSFNL